jgi:hypothetical protein
VSVRRLSRSIAQPHANGDRTLAAYAPKSNRPKVPGSHVRDHLVPLLNRNTVGPAKLDLLLRGIAQGDPGRRGLLPASIS